MDNLVCSIQQRKPTKFKAKSTKRKPNKPMECSPIKVVYISNPMRVKATASEFRSLVQELTGQDSELPFDPADPHQTVPLHDSSKDELLGGGGGGGGASQSPAAEDDQEPAQEVPAVDLEPSPYDIPVPSGDAPTSSTTFDEDYPDEVFTPQMLDNLVGLCPSSLLYESYSDLSGLTLLSHPTVVPEN